MSRMASGKAARSSGLVLSLKKLKPAGEAGAVKLRTSSKRAVTRLTGQWPEEIHCQSVQG